MVVEGLDGADGRPSYHNGTEKQWEIRGKSETVHIPKADTPWAHPYPLKRLHFK